MYAGSALPSLSSDPEYFAAVEKRVRKKKYWGLNSRVFSGLWQELTCPEETPRTQVTVAPATYYPRLGQDPDLWEKVTLPFALWA